jgi:hypothetical protein
MKARIAYAVVALATTLVALINAGVGTSPG